MVNIDYCPTCKTISFQISMKSILELLANSVSLGNEHVYYTTNNNSSDLRLKELSGKGSPQA